MAKKVNAIPLIPFIHNECDCWGVGGEVRGRAEAGPFLALGSFRWGKQANSRLLLCGRQHREVEKGMSSGPEDLALNPGCTTHCLSHLEQINHLNDIPVSSSVTWRKR